MEAARARPVGASELRTALERWADEDAAGAHETRRTTVRSAAPVGLAPAAVDPAVAVYAPVIVVSVRVVVASGGWAGACAPCWR